MIGQLDGAQVEPGEGAPCHRMSNGVRKTFLKVLSGRTAESRVGVGGRYV